MLSNTPKAKVRLSDIAREAGVSVMAVSEVLNPRNNSVRVSQATREKITQVAKSLNYKPNQAARQLAGQSSKIIGVLLDSRAPMTYYHLLAALESEFSQQDYRILVGHSHNSPERIKTYLNDFLSRGVEGVVMISHDYPEYREPLQEILKDIGSAVYIYPPSVPGNSYVESDIAGGIIQAIGHLRDTGKKRIALVNFDSEGYSLKTRKNGYVAGLSEHGFTFEEKLVFNVPIENVEIERLREIIPQIATGILAEKADAVIAINDHCAAILMGEFTRHGLHIPQDMAVVGIDNDEVSLCTTPQLTTIGNQYAKVASSTVDLLMESIKKKGAPPRAIKVPTRLIIRGSTQ